jgi:hypothetical protein
MESFSTLDWKLIKDSGKAKIKANFVSPNPTDPTKVHRLKYLMKYLYKKNIFSSFSDEVVIFRFY